MQFGVICKSRDLACASRVEKVSKNEVLRMKVSIVGNVPTPRDSIFKLSPGSKRPYKANNLKKIKIQIFMIFI